MCYYILPKSGVHISHTSVQPLSDEDMRNPDVNKSFKAFDDNISVKLAKNEILVDAEDPSEVCHLDDNADLDDTYLPYEPEAEMPEADDYTEKDLDKYLTARFLLTAGELELMGTVKQRKNESNGNPVWVYESNPIINT